MAEEKKVTSLKAFRTLCSMLDNNGWRYKKNEDDLNISCGAQGDDLPMDIFITIDDRRELVSLLSRMPFVIEEDKRMETAVAVSIVNNRLVDGSFDYNIADGVIFFRMTSTFIDSELSEEVFKYMLYCSCSMIDRFNDKFLMFSKGLMKLEDFMNC